MPYNRKAFMLEGIGMVATNDTEMVELSKKEIIVGLLTPGEYRFSDLVTYYGLSIFPVLYKGEGRPGVPALGYFTGIGVTEDVPYEGRLEIKDLVLFLTTTRIKADRELVPVFALIDKDVAVEANVSPLALELGSYAFKRAQKKENTQHLVEMCREIKAKYTGNPELTDNKPLDRAIAWGKNLHYKYEDTSALLIYKSEGQVKADFIKGGGTQVAAEHPLGYYKFFLVPSEEPGDDQYREVVIDADTLLPVFALIERGTLKDIPLIALALGQDALDSLQSPDTIERLAELWLGNPQHTW